MTTNWREKVYSCKIQPNKSNHTAWRKLWTPGIMTQKRTLTDTKGEMTCCDSCWPTAGYDNAPRTAFHTHLMKLSLQNEKKKKILSMPSPCADRLAMTWGRWPSRYFQEIVSLIPHVDVQRVCMGTNLVKQRRFLSPSTPRCFQLQQTLDFFLLLASWPCNRP